MNIDDKQDHKDRAFAHEFALRLRDMAHRLQAGRPDSEHAIATALLTVGIEAAGQNMTREQVAEWLKEVGEALLEPDPDQGEDRAQIVPFPTIN